MKRNLVITGGAGFIGSHVVRLFVNKYPEYHIINLDKLTYAGNLANLKDIENKLYQGSIHIRKDQRDGYSESASGCKAVLGESAREV